MAQQTINVGAVANDNTGDPIRDAFVKVNDNFDEAYGAGLIDSNIVTPGNEATPTTADANAITTSVDDADLTIKANGTGQLILDTTTVRITGTTTPGAAIGAVGDTQGDIVWDVNYIWVCTADYDGASSIWKKAALAAF